MTKLADLYACEQCHVLSIHGIYDMKQREINGFCYVCRASRRFIPVALKATPKGQIILEVPSETTFKLP